jgi:hypothetical protein
MQAVTPPARDLDEPSVAADFDVGILVTSHSSQLLV